MVEVRKRLQDEPPLGEPRMRDLQPGLGNHCLAVKEQVEIHRPRPASRPAGAIAAEAPLDVEQRREQLAWRQARLDLDGAVQEPRLIDDADRRRVPQRGHAYYFRPGQLAYGRDGAPQPRFAVAEVRAETDERARHRGKYPQG